MSQPFGLLNEQMMKNSRQMLLVVAEDWNNPQAILELRTKDNESWRLDKRFPAVCGQNGMAWGGNNPLDGPSIPSKTEGDRKTPVGIFTLGYCMGYARQLENNPKWPYRQITETMQGVDDPASRFYNQIVDVADIQFQQPVDWNSNEVMLRSDQLYKWLIVIECNPKNIPGAGSLIFLHLWESPLKGTAGCIAVAEPTILEILGWLDPDLHPVIAMLPRDIYLELSVHWGLPV